MVDVSVLTPSYNYGRFIEDAILSVAAQAGLSVEHIVQDAASTDTTKDVLERLGTIIDWSSEPDEGQSDALNRAFLRAQGRWIAWLNADEFYLPGALEALVRVGEERQADIVYGECAQVDESGVFTRLLAQHRFSPRILRQYGCFISSNSTIFRRSALGGQPWDPSIRRIMDWDLYMKLMVNGARFSHTFFPVGAFRVHSEQITSAPWQHFREEDSKVHARYGHPPDPFERWRATRIGRWLHPVYKLGSGGYVRQARARKVVGRDLRWFREEVGPAGAAELLRVVYERGIITKGT